MHIIYDSDICIIHVLNTIKLISFFQHDVQVLFVVSYKGKQLKSQLRYNYAMVMEWRVKDMNHSYPNNRRNWVTVIYSFYVTLKMLTVKCSDQNIFRFKKKRKNLWIRCRIITGLPKPGYFVIKQKMKFLCVIKV